VLLVIRRLLPTDLRAQLAIAIALVTAVGVLATFLALYAGTTSRMRSQVDAQLRTQQAEWQQLRAHAAVSSPAALQRTAARFIAGQRYHAASLIIVVQVNGGHTVSSDPEIIGREESRAEGIGEAPTLLSTPPGLSDVGVEEAGDMRVLTQPIRADGRQVGTLRVAYPLTPVQQTQASLRRTFLVVALVALVLAAGAGIGLATLIASPLRRIARVAAAVEGGDLSVRAGPTAARGEVRVLSDAVDHMLDRLEQVFKRQRDFVSDASHELRTPLAVLRAQVELLDREADEQLRHEGTRTLLRRLDELDRLVGDMLTLASAEAGQLVEPRPIDLHDFFEDLRRDLPLFGDRDFRVLAIDGTLTADPDRLTQVLRNLVRNAVAHTTPGDRVVVEACPQDGHLEITVSDSGPGIPPDQLEEIFERFHRAGHDRSRDTGGSGLGLAIARAITEAHGGRIHAESSPGDGATFRIDLPGYRPLLSSAAARAD
jgi:two-component system OmpR family sensor kinase